MDTQDPQAKSQRRDKRLTRHVWTLTLLVSFVLLVIVIVSLMLAH
jgi:hypothetical protein